MLVFFFNISGSGLLLVSLRTVAVLWWIVMLQVLLMWIPCITFPSFRYIFVNTLMKFIILFGSEHLFEACMHSRLVLHFSPSSYFEVSFSYLFQKYSLVYLQLFPFVVFYSILYSKSPLTRCDIQNCVSITLYFWLVWIILFGNTTSVVKVSN